MFMFKCICLHTSVNDGREQEQKFQPCQIWVRQSLNVQTWAAEGRCRRFLVGGEHPSARQVATSRISHIKCRPLFQNLEGSSQWL